MTAIFPLMIFVIDKHPRVGDAEPSLTKIKSPFAFEGMGLKPAPPKARDPAIVPGLFITILPQLAPVHKYICILGL